MKRVAIGDICSINPRLPGSMSSQMDRDVDFVPMANLGEDGRISVNGSRKLGEVLKGYTYFENGDVIVAKITPCLENGKAAYVSGLPHGVGFGSTEFHVLRPDPEVEPRYLFYMIWTPRFRHEAARNMTGTAGQQRVPANFFKRFEIPLPPLSEQKRIAAILDKADAIRRKRTEATAQYQEVLQSAFLEMFGDPLRNPKGWPMSSFGEQVKKLEYGPRFYNEPYSPDGIRIVRITDLDFLGGLDFDAMPRMQVSEDITQARCLQPGDIILARSGATVGKSALIEDGDPEAIAGAYFIRLQFKPAITPLFAKMVLNCKPIQRIIAERSKQSAQQNFSGPGIRALPLPLAPQKLQEQFVSVRSQIGKVQSASASHKAETDVLFHALIQRAFRGEL